MAAIIADLDGTTFSWGTNTFVPGAYERLRQFYDAGNEIVFMTQRDPVWNIQSPEPMLKQLFPNCVVLFGITSPRILINDAGAFAVNHKTDAPWPYNFSGVDNGSAFRQQQAGMD